MMNHLEMLKLMNRIYAHLPHNNPIRKEVWEIMNNLKAMREQLPPVEIVNEPT